MNADETEDPDGPVQLTDSSLIQRALAGLVPDDEEDS